MRIAVVVAAGLLASARPARADSCSGGGDGGSSSSSGSSGGGSYSSSDSSSSSEPACVESSDVLGRRTCTGFATWAMPPMMPRLSLETVTSARIFPAAKLGASGTVDHGEHGSYQYRMVGGDPEGADLAGAFGVDFRILGGKHVYGGLELGIARVAGVEGATTTTSGAEEMPGAGITSTVQVLFTGGAVLGARAAAGPLTLSAEVLGGARVYRTEVTSEYGACVTTDSDSSAEGALEGRGRIDAWVSPWMTLGVFAGTDLRVPDTHVVGVSLGGHLRAFDGLR